MFVNLHPADLEDPELYADDGALTPYASQVVLEITERAALDRIHELQHARDAAARSSAIASPSTTWAPVTPA